jgi:hypothetical protein
VDVAEERRRQLANQLRRIVQRWSEPADQWRAKVQRWVDAGIVSPGQGEEILALESSESPASDAGRPAISPFIEFISYIGVVAMGVGTVLYLSHYWSVIGRAGHISVGLTVTAAGLFAGSVIAHFGDASASRLSGFLRLLGTVGAALTTIVAVGAATESHHGLTLLCVGVVVLTLSASLWRNLDRSLQFLSTLLGLALTLGAVGIVAHLHATSTEVSLLVWFIAAAVGLMGLQMLRPAPTALVVAEFGCFVGAFALSFPNHLGGVLLGVLSALSAVGVGFAVERAPIIVIGAVGFFMFDFRIFAIYLHSTNAAFGAFVLGLVLLFFGLWRAWKTATRERSEATTTTEVHPDAEWYESW